MGNIFTLDSGTKSVIQAALDDLITELGKDCLLVYPGKWNGCANCLPGPGGTSSNRWKTGGPLPFPNGTTCPVCTGTGKRFDEVTEVIKLLCEWEPKHFVVPVPSLDLRVPYSLLQTKGYLKDAPKIMRADALFFQVASEGVVRKKYQLLAQPGDRSNIIQGRYFVCLWEQVQ